MCGAAKQETNRLISKKEEKNPQRSKVRERKQEEKKDKRLRRRRTYSLFSTSFPRFLSCLVGRDSPRLMLLFSSSSFWIFFSISETSFCLKAILSPFFCVFVDRFCCWDHDLVSAFDQREERREKNLKFVLGLLSFGAKGVFDIRHLFVREFGP